MNLLRRQLQVDEQEVYIEGGVFFALSCFEYENYELRSWVKHSINV